MAWCEGYDGIVFDDPETEVPFVYPEGSVALNSVTYVRGVGMNCRVVNIPATDADVWNVEAERMGLCNCSPPAVWLFTAIDGTEVSTFHTLDTHEAVHLMQHPDHIFDKNYPGGGVSLRSDLRMVAAEHGMMGVVTEMCDYLAGRGVQGMRDDGGITYDEVVGFDVDDFTSQLFGESDDSR